MKIKVKIYDSFNPLKPYNATALDLNGNYLCSTEGKDETEALTLLIDKVKIKEIIIPKEFEMEI